MYKLKIPPGIVMRNANIPNIHNNIKVIVGSDEKIYDKTYISAIVNERIVKFLKESVSYT